MPRSRQSTDEAVNRVTCPTCRKKELGFMVQCDGCDKWYHGTCVGIDESIGDQDWFCKRCLQPGRKQLETSKDTISEIEDALRSIYLSQAKASANQQEASIKRIMDAQAERDERFRKEAEAKEERLRQEAKDERERLRIESEARDERFRREAEARDERLRKEANEAQASLIRTLMSAMLPAQDSSGPLSSAIQKPPGQQPSVPITKPPGEHSTSREPEPSGQQALQQIENREILPPAPFQLDAASQDGIDLNPQAPPFISGNVDDNFHREPFGALAFNNFPTRDEENRNSPRGSQHGSDASIATSIAERSVIAQEQTASALREMGKAMVSQSAAMVSQSAMLGRQYVMDLPVYDGTSGKSWALFERTFEDTTRVGKFTELENSNRLLKHLKGEPLTLAQPLLLGQVPVQDVMKRLKFRFARRDEQHPRMRAELLEIPDAKRSEPERLWNMSNKLQAYVQELKAMKFDAVLFDNDLVMRILGKLSSGLYVKWQKFSFGKNELSVELLADFITDSLKFLPPVIKPTTKAELPGAKKTRNVMSHSEVTSEESESGKCKVCYSSAHPLAECKVFKNLDPKQRMTIIKGIKGCFFCLGTSQHDFKNCSKKKKCSKDGCESFHHPMLHGSSEANKSGGNKKQWKNKNNGNSSSQGRSTQDGGAAQSSSNAASTSDSQPHSTHSEVMMAHESRPKTLFKIVPVTVYGPSGKAVDDFAFLDDGSGVTMVERSLIKEVDVVGSEEIIRLKWTNNIVREENSMKTTLLIGPRNSKKRFKFEEVNAIRDLELPQLSIDVGELKEKFKYLKGLPLPDLSCAKPRILIGLRHPKHLTAIKARTGGDDDPVAAKHPLGWVVYGPNLTSMGIESEGAYSHFQLTIQPCPNSDEEMHRIVKDHFSTENFGVTPTSQDFVSADVKRAQEVMQNSLKYIDGRYEIGLLWRRDNERLPNSLPMALRRLTTLERSLAKDPEKLNWKNNHVRELVEKGYARVATEEDLTTRWPRVWYCPTFIVTNKNKIPVKHRDVADVAAKVGDHSLNSFLLPGPVNLAPLFSGLFKFRENAIAVNADVKEMFHQVSIKPEDQQCQRFLWRDGDTSKEPTVYIMQRMMFGPTCSPSCAQFVKNTHAEKFREKFPEAVDGLVNRTYVDDYFNSHSDPETALRVCNDAIGICKTMGFNLVGFQSNSHELLSQLSPEIVKTDLVSLIDDSDITRTSKVLGMFWEPKSDTFTYKLFRDDFFDMMITPNHHPTKREILRFIMRVFDPLGFSANFLIRGKFIMQEIWIDGTGWDDVISERLRDKWAEFLAELMHIEEIKIPRRYSSFDFSKGTIELIVFVDASERAFAATGYFRTEYAGEVDVRQVMGKSKVAPTKRLTIPQLELQAAVLGVRLADTIRKLHNFNFRIRFLTDSRVVELWILSEKFNFKTFVAARVGEILDKSSRIDWFHVPSKHNVADDGTKWAEGQPMGGSDSRWLKGPEFLRLPDNQWPVTASLVEKLEEEYDRETFPVLMIEPVVSKNFALPTIDQLKPRFKARWSSTVRVIAFMLRLTEENKPSTKIISPDEFARAEERVFQKIQRDSFPKEYRELEVKDSPKDLGRLSKFNPFMQEGLIRMSSRAQFANVSYAARNPIILPNRHPLVEKFIEYYHADNFHQGEEMIISELRGRVWIIDIRSAVRRVKKACQKCKNSSSIPKHPIMGQLPRARIDFGVKPFTHTGLDVFGPYEVNIRRNTKIKRYVLLFTCMTYRAVHLELLDDLSTDSCIVSMRCFLARRGWCRHFYSDNGKNFVGAQKVLENELKEVTSSLGEAAANRLKVEWHFIPAYSPWFGGAWERLIQSVKKCFDHVMNGESPNESVLRGALIMAEYWINKRPLTHNPVDHEDAQPLTPNSVLFGDNYDELGESIAMPVSRDYMSKKAPKRVEHLTQKFLSRWVSEYLPSILVRERWRGKTNPIREGDIAILVEPAVPKKAWSKCRVIKTHPGPDDIVRSVDVMMADKSIKKSRSVGRLAVLDVRSASTLPDGGDHVVDGTPPLQSSEYQQILIC